MACGGIFRSHIGDDFVHRVLRHARGVTQTEKKVPSRRARKESYIRACAKSGKNVKDI